MLGCLYQLLLIVKAVKQEKIVIVLFNLKPLLQIVVAVRREFLVDAYVCNY